MSVLIKGMKMPKSCYDCQFAVDGMCVAMQPIRTRNRSEKDTTNFCPLIELPDHGDLIDRDELMKHGVYMPMDGGSLPLVYMSYVKGAKAVIPAERGEDGRSNQ